MGHKYLTNLGIKEDSLPWEWCGDDDERQSKWKKERKEYGFDERDTWNLNYTLTLMIYERLRFYRDFAPVSMDKVDFSHTYEIDGEKFAYGAIIDRILVSFSNRLTSDDFKMNEEELKEFKKCWELLGKIYWSLWW